MRRLRQRESKEESRIIRGENGRKEKKKKKNIKTKGGVLEREKGAALWAARRRSEKKWEECDNGGIGGRQRLPFGSRRNVRKESSTDRGRENRSCLRAA
ncbi:hypothetical protein ACFXTN_025574 [Malus domestica]